MPMKLSACVLLLQKSISVPTPQPEIRRRFWKKKSLSRDDGLSASSGGLEMKHEDGLQSLFPPLAILPKPTTPQPTRSRAFVSGLQWDVMGLPPTLSNVRGAVALTIGSVPRRTVFELRQID